jgi:hypothetical protein
MDFRISLGNGTLVVLDMAWASELDKPAWLACRVNLGEAVLSAAVRNSVNPTDQ